MDVGGGVSKKNRHVLGVDNIKGAGVVLGHYERMPEIFTGDVAIHFDDDTSVGFQFASHPFDIFGVQGEGVDVSRQFVEVDVG